jgi:hypothetical protein
METEIALHIGLLFFGVFFIVLRGIISKSTYSISVNYQKKVFKPLFYKVLFTVLGVTVCSISMYRIVENLDFYNNYLSYLFLLIGIIIISFKNFLTVKILNINKRMQNILSIKLYEKIYLIGGGLLIAWALLFMIIGVLHKI